MATIYPTDSFRSATDNGGAASFNNNVPAVPVANAIPNPNPNPIPKSDLICMSLCCIAIIVIVLALIGDLIAMAVIDYKYPMITPTVTLTSLSVSSFNLTADSLTADFDLAFAIDNPASHRMSVHYDRLIATVYLGQAVDHRQFNAKNCECLLTSFYFGLNRLGAATPLALPFLPRNTSAAINARMTAVSVMIGEDAANSIRSGFEKGDANVNLNVLVGAVMRLECPSLMGCDDKNTIRLDCLDVNVAFAKNATLTAGTMNNGPIQCQ